MDYLPPERPTVIAQMKESEHEGHVLSAAWEDIGMIKGLLGEPDWADTTTFMQRMHLRELKPGQRVVFAKPVIATEPSFYIQQHKPCSTNAFNTFQRILSSNQVNSLSDAQLHSLGELLGTKVTDKSFRTQADITIVSGQRALSVLSSKRGDEKFSHALYVVADSKKHWVQEIGFEGGKFKRDNWTKEADQMLLNMQLKVPK